MVENKKKPGKQEEHVLEVLEQFSQGSEHGLQTLSDSSPQKRGGQNLEHDFKSRKSGVSQLVHTEGEPAQSLHGVEHGLHILS